MFWRRCNEIDDVFLSSSALMFELNNKLMVEHGIKTPRLYYMDEGFEEPVYALVEYIDGVDLNYVLEECCKEEQVYLREHGGVLFPNLEETLEILKRNYNLYIVSNCQDGYIQAFLEYHNLNCYFDDFEMSGRTGKSKGENIKIIMNRNELDKAVYVGDTQGDLNAADFAEIPFIFASYGFGNIDRKEVFISSISEIPKIVKRIL